MRRVRLSVRGLIIAVVLAAATLAIFDRQRRFRRIAARHAAWLGREGLAIELGPTSPGAGARVDWRLRMANKYAQAARRPWLPVATDPPEPK